MHPDTIARPGYPALGLGCSRLGSVGGASAAEARELLRVALREGIRVFDTANIYGQGDSERLIGEAIADRDDCVIISKGGKYITWYRRGLLPFKTLIRSVVRHSSGSREMVSHARSKPMPSRWDARALNRSLRGSLRRLGRQHIDIFMLHSPSADVIRSGEAVAALEAARIAGRIGIVGVSVDDVDAAAASLEDPRVRAIQVPLHPGSNEFDEVITKAWAVGVLVIAREVLGGPAGLASRKDTGQFASARVAQIVSDPRISIALVGATRAASVRASASSAREARLGDA